MLALLVSILGVTGQPMPVQVTQVIEEPVGDVEPICGKCGEWHPPHCPCTQ